MAKNFYDVLGVEKGSSEKDIRAAYRKLARQYHPDVNPGDAKAETKFKEINSAYQVLSDAESRKKYDRHGDNWKHAGDFERSGSSGASPFTWFNRASRGGGQQRTSPGSGGLGDIFGDIFSSGGSQFGESIASQRVEVAVAVTLEEAYSGAKRMVLLPEDSMRGTPGRRLEVSIPVGVRSGSKVHIGTPQGAGGGLDLSLKIKVSPHRVFEWKDDDLLISVNVPLADLMLGGEVEVPTITGSKVVLKVPAVTQNGKAFRLKGKGMPRKGAKGVAHGDEVVTLKAVLPSELTDEDRQLFERLRESSTEAEARQSA
ncbi:MAG: DnaJ domain-containing protein [Chloroflexi bacterium]|nr:DnaJ domain-containing protein [Chloroflexota bacterium]